MLRIIGVFILLGFLSAGNAHGSNLLGFTSANCAEIVEMMDEPEGRRIARWTAGSFFSGFNMQRMLFDQTYHDLSALAKDSAVDGAILTSCSRMLGAPYAAALLNILEDLPLKRWEE